MKLNDGQPGNVYQVCGMTLGLETERRLQALGLTLKTPVTVMNKKRHGAMIVKIRGTRFALGRQIAENIEVEGV